ncbi:type II toxin-antitoxin system RelE/ParE family toxin [Deltaproteobacteria bacterium PRO3]|nr:type II toxin-antitoxin system RelE/ParE family toxin [Deltaproteobacteria bacterium PRO3]
MGVKSYRVRIHSDALRELEGIYRFIGEDSPARARRFTEGLKRKILALGRFPRRGRRVELLEGPEGGPEIRFIEHNGYLIFYTVEVHSVLVLHLTAPGRDWRGLFL